LTYIPVVQTLVGKKQLNFYLSCIGSLIEKCEEKVSIHFHTDGSLSAKEEDFVYSHYPRNEIFISDFNSSTADTLDALSGRPNCQNFRRHSIWGIEFFDPLFAYPAKKISFYVDADILFTQPFSGLFNLDQVKGTAVFLKDIQWDAYCLRPWDFWSLNKKPEVVKGITTGLVFWDKTAIDWDYLEWFLGAHHLHHIPEWIMPTAQAGLANRCDAKSICPRQIPNLYPNAQIFDETFGVHLLGSYRQEWLKRLETEMNTHKGGCQPIFANFRPCKKQSSFCYALKQLKRWKNTRLDLW
jgi:hypothetical protein